jgi:hypothetical protein
MLRIIESVLAGDDADEQPTDLAEIIGIRAPAVGRGQSQDIDGARKIYVQGCLKLLERGERLPNRVLLLVADELGWGEDDS